MIDWLRVTELRTEVGEDDFVEVIDLFMEEVEEVTIRLASSPDPSRYEEDLHFLKGSALNLGFRDFSAMCQTGEKLAANGQADQVCIADVLACYALSRQEFLAGVHSSSQAA